jgi:hypothetical protein
VRDLFTFDGILWSEKVSVTSLVMQLT